MNKLSKEQLWSYFILVARVLLAWTLLHYGWGKLVGDQFGVHEATLNKALKDVDLLSLSWYLADHEPFKSFIGSSQIIAALLILYNRTVLVGALMAIPIWLTILMWDLTFMGWYTPFTIRLPFYLLLTFLILWHQKGKVVLALALLTQKRGSRRSYPLWAYMLLPVLAICLEFVGALPSALLQLFRK
ncbi:MAG: DoxX family membrane protein [Sphingobacteriales bacterium]|nr:MAG: DoxX family membrane protein [Sphingobacteriales bacterium]